jgi:hypothetical protein
MKNSIINYNPAIFHPHLYPQNPFLTRAPKFTPPPKGVTIYPASTTSLANFPSLATVHTLQQEAISHNQSFSPLHFPLLQPLTNPHWSFPVPVPVASTTEQSVMLSSQTFVSLQGIYIQKHIFKIMINILQMRKAQV